MARSLVVLLGLALFAGAAAQELRLAPEEAQAVRAVIEAQLDAFRKDDAARAYSYASDGIRQAFPTPEKFLEMVRTSYPVVYRPRSVEFAEPVLVELGVVQPVVLSDAAGRYWLALYPMVRRPDGVWRIDGCQLKQLPKRAA